MKTSSRLIVCAALAFIYTLCLLVSFFDEEKCYSGPPSVSLRDLLRVYAIFRLGLLLFYLCFSYAPLAVNGNTQDELSYLIFTNLSLMTLFFNIVWPIVGMITLASYTCGPTLIFALSIPTIIWMLAELTFMSWHIVNHALKWSRECSVMIA